MSRLRSAAAIITVGALGAAALLAVPLSASGAETGIRINEVESDGGIPGDWIEFLNTAETEVDLSGFVVKDNSDGNSYTFPQDTVVAAGAYLVIDQRDSGSGAGQFDFGLGKDDQVRLFDPLGALVDETSWTGHAVTTRGVRDVDGAVEWAVTAEATKGAENVFPSTEPVGGSLVINEVDSQPADWVEFYNPGDEALDISGYEIRDNSDDHRWQFLPGTSIAAGGFLVVDEASVGLVGGVEAPFREPIGIGSADRIRLFDAAGAMIDDTLPWTGHAAIDGDAAAATFARCPDGAGVFALAYATQGAPNSCVVPDVVINEIESNGDTTDWVEVLNTGSTPVDLSGWTVMDNDPVGHAAEATPLAAGTVLAPGAYLVFDQPTDFVFGLGNGDTVTLRDANGNTVDEHVYTAHAAGVLARCPDGTGDVVDIATSTKGLRNACGNPVRINEIESDGGTPGDWVELVNPTDSALDVSGLVVKDDDDAHAYAIPTGTTIVAGGYLVIEGADLGFGLGAGDAVRVFDGDLLVDSTSWGEGHAATTWGRCPDTTGVFGVTERATKGAANACAGEIAVSAWPGSPEVRVLDSAPTFLEDSSGLDVQETADGAVLWAVDNGEGRIFKLAVQADGSFATIPGWEAGKRVRFQKDAANPAAAGPDTEGITVDGDGLVYVASERDNSAKGVNLSTILKVDPEAAQGDLVAQQEWDLTSLLPAVGANLGMEAVQWVPDSALDGKLFDRNTGAAYDPTDYAGRGDGLFFVAVEDNGHVYAFALNDDGSATLVSEIAPGLAGVMALDYDSVLGVLWAVCDDGCQGRSAQITLNGTAQPGIAHFARPAGMPDINNEGFATAPASLAVNGQRPVWWFADGFASEALRTGTLPANVGGNPGGGNPGGGNPGANPGQTPPLPGTALTDGNRNGVTVNPSVARRGDRVTVSVGADRAGEGIAVWMYSDPVLLASGAASAAGTFTVTIPTDAPLGAHRIAIYTASGELVGWADIRITAGGALAATGAEAPTFGILLAIALLVAGAAAMRRRRQSA
ncbi:lamin tail domain-containing protein [Microbacterium sp. LWO14-1.2]|uniref:lamin tail domain-containing protein n=1 Tax=Microbacterium sp. LWO14-1.2 TaxID=3135263 RepID=UPI00313926FB